MAYHGSAVQYHDLDSYSEATRTKTNGCRYIVAATILTIAVAAVIIIALGVPLGVINEKYGSSVTSTSTSPISDTTMCLTPECIKLAASVLSAIDQTVDPCTDFYKFSCGNWIQNTIIPMANCEFELLSCTTCIYMVG